MSDRITTALGGFLIGFAIPMVGVWNFDPLWVLAASVSTGVLGAVLLLLISYTDSILSRKTNKEEA